MVRVKFDEMVPGYCRIMSPRYDNGNKFEEWASPQLLTMIVDSMAAANRGFDITALYNDLISICGEPLEWQWGRQLIMEREDALFLQLKHGNLVESISDNT